MKCLNCGKETCNPKFCNNSCAASFNNKHRRLSEETKRKISKSLKCVNIQKCKECGEVLNRRNKTGFCKKCLRYSDSSECKELRIQFSKKAGRASSKLQFERKRSKNETYFFELVRNYFQDALNNVNMFNGWDADIVIPTLKVAILWNGVWHYKDICGQLKQTTNRDNIKYHEIVSYGYLPYIIVDMGKFSKVKCEQELKRFLEFVDILKNTLNIISNDKNLVNI